MELHRLTPMRKGYDEKLFNKLYKQTKSLRRNLAKGIDARRYGVTPDVIESWFEDKFIFVFNKHFDNKDPDVLKGFIINSLKTFKYRILRKAYNGEGEFHQSIVELEGESSLINIIPDDSLETTESIFYSLVYEFMKSKLTDNAWLVFQLQLNPPPYILNQMDKSKARIPNELIIEYLGLDYTHESERFIKKIKKEINNAIKIAREYFNSGDFIYSENSLI